MDPRGHLTRTAALLVAAAAAPFPAGAQRPTRAQPPPSVAARAGMVDSSLALATFDSAWRTVGTSLAGRGVTRVDWTAVRTELRPRAARASTDSALRVVLDAMLRRIGESHFAVLPGSADRDARDSTPAPGSALGTIGLDVRWVAGAMTVWRVDTRGAAASAGVRPGWTLDRVDDEVVPSLAAADETPMDRIAPLMRTIRALHGTPGSAVRLTLRDSAGTRRVVSIVRRNYDGAVARFGNLPPLPVSFDWSRRAEPGDRCVGVIAFDYWMPPVIRAFDRAIDSLRTCAGLVLDLRGNLGGIAGMMMGVAGHLLPDARTLGVMRTRGEEMRFVANPRRVRDDGSVVEPFAGPVAILVDGLSASTSEMFAAAMQSLGRARLFGERTAGQALPAVATRLPNGDVLMHVVADFVTPDGVRIEGRGVLPDEVTPLSGRDLAAGRDAPLEAALTWIRRPAPRDP